MTEYEFVGYTLINTTAVTAITGTSNIWHGLRPKTTDLPSINYLELGGDFRNGIERRDYSINCRSATAAGARDLARQVLIAFTGTSGTGIYGTTNSFDVARASLRNDNGLIPEPEDNVFNAPVDITIVYPSSTVS